MDKSALLLGIMLLVATVCGAQIFPVEGAHLNYLIAGFSFPFSKGEGKCVVEVARGTSDNKFAFETACFLRAVSENGKVVGRLPEWGRDYTWRVVRNGNAPERREDYHHFTTLVCPAADTGKQRLRVLKNETGRDDFYILVDATQTMYEPDGTPVWFLPEKAQTTIGNSNVRDLKPTGTGTLTLIENDRVAVTDKAREIDYNGNVTWQNPAQASVSGEQSEHIHHEVTKLANGHFMTMGSEKVELQLPLFQDDSDHYRRTDATLRLDSNKTFWQSLAFGTLIEYDREGKVVWSWKSSEYFRQTDLFTSFLPNGKFAFPDVHENAFFADIKNGIVYVGFREISCILKISYPDGKVIAAYGPEHRPGSDTLEKYFFYGQHSIEADNSGGLLIYSNNLRTPDELPELLYLKPAGSERKLKEGWRYVCRPEGLDSQELASFRRRSENSREKRSGPRMPKKLMMTSGGNVTSLGDGYYFAAASEPVNRLMIIDRNRHEAWSAVIERKNSNSNQWTTVGTYRASILYRKSDLPDLIWQRH